MGHTMIRSTVAPLSHQLPRLPVTRATLRVGSSPLTGFMPSAASVWKKPSDMVAIDETAEVDSSSWPMTKSANSKGVGSTTVALAAAVYPAARWRRQVATEKGTGQGRRLCLLVGHGPAKHFRSPDA